MFSISEIIESECDLVLSDGTEAPDSLVLLREWEGAICKAELQNRSSKPVCIHSVVLFSIPHSLPLDTRIYGEGFQMLSQTGGTVGNPIQLGGYTDEAHYRLVPPEGAKSAPCRRTAQSASYIGTTTSSNGSPDRFAASQPRSDQLE